jgi:hypothetical protein
MTIRRPNVRARLYQPNLQARHPGNRKYSPRNFHIYSKQCRWCKRPREWLHANAYPGFCYACDEWLRQFEWGATMLIDDHDDRIRRFLAGYRSDGDD